MDNKEFARVFSEIADVLEIQQENVFRIRSYRRAAQVLESAAFDVQRAVNENPEAVRALSGIGPALFSKIVEISETGTCAEHQKLLEEIPPPVLEMLELPGVGPKKIALFLRSGIRGLADLEEEAAAGRLRELPGVGEKSEAGILQALERRRKTQGRFRISEARETGVRLAAHLSAGARLVRLEAAGSLRRWRETVADIDLLAAAPDPGAVMEALAAYPEVREVLVRGETKSSVRLRSGMQVDLRVVPETVFGAALQYFTGSMEHNVVLRERAKRMGLKISEYGLFDAEQDRLVAGGAEEELYRLLGLQFIPPELRENRGEIEAAERDGLPRLLELQDLKGDLHMHTRESDGQNSVEQMAAAARAAGYDYIAITDHSRSVTVANGLDAARLLRQVEEIRTLREKGELPLHVFAGAEVDILADGSLDFPDAVLQELDLVIAAVHSRLNMPAAEMTQRICRAIENPHVDILAHPTGRLIPRRPPCELDLDAVLETARRCGVALELNAYPARLDLGDLHCRRAREAGVLVSIGSDSHRVDMLSNISYGVHTARRGWLEPAQVLNAAPLEALQRHLKSRG